MSNGRRPNNIGVQMNRNELTKTFMLILNGLCKSISAVLWLKSEHSNVIRANHSKLFNFESK